MGGMVSFSLDKKLILLVLAVSLIAITATAVLSLNLVDGMLREKIKAQLVEESASRGNAIKILLDGKINEIVALSSEDFIKNTVSELNGHPEGRMLHSKIAEKGVSLSVETRNFQIGQGRQIELVDLMLLGDGLAEYFTLEGGSEFPPKSELLELADGQFMRFMQDSKKDRVLVIAMPVRDGGGVIGTMAAITGTKSLDRILGDREGLRDTGEAYIVNQDGVIISESAFVEDAEFVRVVDTVPVTACFDEGRTISGEVYHDHRGERVFGISYCQDGYGYVVLTEIDEGEVLLPLFDLQEKIIVVSAVIMAVISGVAYGLSRRLSGPIRRLTDAAREISEGNFDVKTEIQTRDEIGELSHSFDTMARRLLASEMALNQQKEIIKQQEDILLQFSDRTEEACVCFIDINESTKICAGLSDSETASLYSGFINSMAAIIRKYGGVVVKNIGDALLFYFRIVDVDREGEFRNVLECCQALVDHHGVLCHKLESKSLPKIDYRISVTFGPVSVASVSTSDVDDVFGSTVNLCAKINSYARPNGIVIGEGMFEKAGRLGGFRFAGISDFQVSESQDLRIFSVERDEGRDIR